MPNEVEYTDLTPVYFRKGDRMFNHTHTFMGTVDRVDRKKVNGTVHFQEEDAAQVVVRLAQGFTVLRSEETPEEKAEAERDYSIRAIRTAIDNAPKIVAARMQDAHDVLENGWASSQMYAVANLISAKMEASLWAKVEKVSVDKDVDLVEAAKMVREYVQKRILQGHGVRLTNVSTSLVSNTAEAIEAEAQFEWLRDLEFKVL